MDKHTLVYAPRAQKDLLGLPKVVAQQILDDLELLKEPQWPEGKVKKLKHPLFWEIKTGVYRTLFVPEPARVIIVMIVNRKDLERELKRFNVQALVRWVREERGR